MSKAKIVGIVVTILLAVGGAVLGLDIKGMVCAPDVPVASGK